MCWRICVKNPFLVFLKTLNEMRKSTPKIIQNVQKKFVQNIPLNVLSPIKKIIINIYFINYSFFLVLFY